MLRQCQCQDIIDAVELHDAIRTQDNDSGSDDFVSFVGLMSNLTEITTCIMLYNTDHKNALTLTGKLAQIQSKIHVATTWKTAGR